MRYIRIGHEVDVATLERRFPIAKLFATVLVGRYEDGIGPVIQFEKNSSGFIATSVIINRSNTVFRAKHVLALSVIEKSDSLAQFRGLLEYATGDVWAGVHVAPEGKKGDYIVAGQFQNMYLSPQLRETTIGEFLRGNPSMIKRAFNCTNYVYEPYLPWLNHALARGDAAINPDLLLQNKDGTVDIYDLKTAALDKLSLTKGLRKRRRFIDYVNEGVAQLAHYREYFKEERHKGLLLEKYGMRIENPKCVLVVGNYDNANPEEIAEASRVLDGIEVIDYDTVTQMFLGASPEANI